ncbi:Glutathione-regulated potassium-efflux system protein KefB [Helicobacter bizzozeronii]|uniref:cation:proton antiporter domain-containing protein n=1 Tax=Helicobacter bizzozeronii TaxID=56877 RepID=UPI00244D83D0|nr:cation:proton antiporter [Helicobacter bizzozeronii]GMB92357.1 Glutathione-regulated potassium-efflux system protein KefB [Helicobacter bizzozeronii]
METHALYVVVVGLGLSVVSGLLLKKIEMPVIIGYILTGLVIALLFHIEDFESLSEIADFGIVFLMFMIGIEFNFDRLKSMKQEVLLFGGLQVIATSLLLLFFGYFVMGSSWGFSLVVSMGFSLSSTAIVLKFFEESKQLNTTTGKIVVGILIFQDIAAIPMLLILMLMGDENANFANLLIKTAISATIILLLLLLPGRQVATKILNLAAESRLPELFMGTILLIVFGAASLSHFFGFSMSLGAFVAGMAISKSRYRIRVQEDFAPLKNIFLGLFFVTVGMQIRLDFLITNFFAVVLLLGLTMSLKVGLLYGILRIFRDAKSAMRAALSLAQIGEFALVVFLSASKHHLLTLQKHEGLLVFLREKGIIQVVSTDIQQFLVLMIVFSMLITPFMLKYLDALVDFFTHKRPSQTASKEEAKS